MRKKAIILDLDNTIYPVSSIGEKIFAPLFDFIKNIKSLEEKIEEFKKEIMRRPFQQVARDFNFSKQTIGKGIEILKEIEYKEKIEPFDDYNFVKAIPVDKYLVTTGFRKMQQSKVDAMQLKHDFKEIFIIDPTTTDKIKKDIFLEIIERHHYKKQDVLIIGDDLNSEIKAAQELEIDAVLYDKLNFYEKEKSVTRITDFRELQNYL